MGESKENNAGIALTTRNKFCNHSADSMAFRRDGDLSLDSHLHPC
jgi:hypothetical protein